MQNKSKNNQQILIYSFRAVCLLLIMLLTVPYSAQTQNNILENVEVKMNDGSTVIGELVIETTDKLIVKTKALGEVTILKSTIIEIKKLRSINIVDGVYWHENPNPTRNLYGPTGYGLRKGEGYYQNILILLNQLSYGFTDQFTIGFGFEIISILAGVNDSSDGPSIPGFTITPKYSIPIKKDKWNIGVGVLALHIPGQDELFSAGILYGVSTWGSRDNNFTLGMGFGITEREFTGKPTITLAGNKRVGRRFGIVTENWFIPFGDDYETLFSFGLRYIGERITWDFALFGNIEGVSPLPLIGIAMPFGEGWKG